MPKDKKLESLLYICLECGKHYTPYHMSQKYCSPECYWKSLKGKKQSRESNKKRSKTLMGHEVSKETIEKFRKANLGSKNPMKRLEVREKARVTRIERGSYFQSEESRRKNSESHDREMCSKRMLLKWQDPNYRKMQSESHKGRRGPKASNWQGGIGSNPYPPDFNTGLKELIRERDNHTCQLCGKTQDQYGTIYYRKFDVHHINYDKDDLFELNLISLCRSCNGKVNIKRDFWEDFFTFKLLWSCRMC